MEQCSLLGCVGRESKALDAESGTCDVKVISDDCLQQLDIHIDFACHAIWVGSGVSTAVFLDACLAGGHMVCVCVCVCCWEHISRMYTTPANAILVVEPCL